MRASRWQTNPDAEVHQRASGTRPEESVVRRRSLVATESELTAANRLQAPSGKDVEVRGLAFHHKLNC